MTDDDAFLAAIAAAPDDDAPRLVYADFLDDRDDHNAAWKQRSTGALRAVLMDPADDGARLKYAEVCERCGRPELGEFIRVQVELARTPDPSPTLRRRELRLWPAVHHFYAADLPADHRRWSVSLDLPNRAVELPEAVVRRGFVEHVTAQSFVLGERCVECPEEGPCRACDNLGTVFNGGLADLFAKQPVTSATLPDLLPTDWGEDDGVAVWSDSAQRGGSECESVMPSALFESLDDFIEDVGGRKVFPTSDAARRAVSPAVVALGRRFVGLPPIPATAPPPNTQLVFEYEPLTPVFRFGGEDA